MPTHFVTGSLEARTEFTDQQLPLCGHGFANACGIHKRLHKDSRWPEVLCMHKETVMRRAVTVFCSGKEESDVKCQSEEGDT